MKKLLFAIPFVLLLLHFALEILFRHVLPYAIIQPGRTTASINPETVRFPYKEVTVEADAISLSGFMVAPADQKPKAVIILIHGIGGNKSHFLSTAEALAEHGFAGFAIDLRAHGESSGQYTTYGYYEKYDIQRVVDFLESKFSGVPVGIWGSSLGGAVALQAMSVDDRLDFGIVESTFRDLEEIMHDYQRRLVGVPMGYYMEKAMRKAEQVANFKVADVKPLQSAADIKKPVLIAQGDADERISYQYGKALFEQLQHPEKEWVLVTGGRHIGLADAGGSSYQDRLFDFLNKQAGSAATAEQPAAE